jgi:hypothetical protein
MLSFDVSERTVSRLMPRRAPKSESAQRWMTFCATTVTPSPPWISSSSARSPSGSFTSGSRSNTADDGSFHFHVTDHPDAAWVVQQLREAFPFDTAPRHLVFDRDGTFSAQVVSMVRSLGAKPTRTAPRSPWQKGCASYCTSSGGSSVRCYEDAASLPRAVFRCLYFAGASVPGGSKRHSPLSL